MIVVQENQLKLSKQTEVERGHTLPECYWATLFTNLQHWQAWLVCHA